MEWPWGTLVRRASDAFPRGCRRVVISHEDITRRKDWRPTSWRSRSQEQRRIGQDLHDTVGQELTALTMLAGDLAEILRTKPSNEFRLVEQIVEGLQRSQRELRTIMSGLIPVPVDAEGLMSALSDLAQRTWQEWRVNCGFDCPEPVSVANNLTATHLYLIAQEAVHNAVKHAGPTKIRIVLESNHLLVNECAGRRYRHYGPAGRGAQWPGPSHHAGQGRHYRRHPYHSAGQPTGTLVTCTLLRKEHET